MEPVVPYARLTALRASSDECSFIFTAVMGVHPE